MWFLFAYFWVRNGAMLEEKKRENSIFGVIVGETSIQIKKK
jgi:hypothetical protein